MAGTFTINDATVPGSVIDATAGKIVSIAMGTAPAPGKHPRTHDTSTGFPTAGAFCLSDNGVRALYSWDMLGASPATLLKDGKIAYTKLMFHSTVQGAVFTVVTQ